MVYHLRKNKLFSKKNRAFFELTDFVYSLYSVIYLFPTSSLAYYLINFNDYANAIIMILYT